MKRKNTHTEYKKKQKRSKTEAAQRKTNERFSSLCPGVAGRKCVVGGPGGDTTSGHANASQQGEGGSKGKALWQAADSGGKQAWR